MAIVAHAVNGGRAEVSDEQAKVLIESGGWVAADAPVKNTPHRGGRKPAAKPAE